MATAPPDLPFAGLNLRRNPFGEPRREERAPLAVTDVEFGLNATHGWDASVINLNIVDNSHYITSTFGTGALPVFNVAQELQFVSGSQALDLQTLGTTTSGASLVIIEAGGQLYDGTSIDGLYITAGGSTVRGLRPRQT